MRKIVLIFLLLASHYSHAQSVCGSLNLFAENHKESSFPKQFLELYSPYGIADETQAGVCKVQGESDWNICRGCSDTWRTGQLESVMPMLKSWSHRYWHLYWHNSFNDGIQLTDSEFEKIKSMGHALSQETKSEYLARNEAHWGESFFFMHRQMIKMLYFELSFNGQACIAPWSEVPNDPLDRNWPIPNEINHGNYRWIRAEIDKMEEGLKTWTLNELGAHIQALHIMLHTTYSEDYSVVERKCPENREIYKESCDDLGDNLSAHANPIFWKLHGYVDAFIGRWLDFNSYKSIGTERECSRKSESEKPCYIWQGSYMGVYPFDIPNVPE